MKASNVVDWDDPDHNMYGCAPCPKCAGKFRASYRRGDALSIECDCGHTETAARDEAPAGGPT